MRLARTLTKENVGFWCGTICSASNRLYVGGTDFNIHVYELPMVQPCPGLPLKGHSSYVTTLLYIPATGMLVSGALDKKLLWWKPAGGEPVRRMDAGGRVNGLAVCPDGRLLVTATDDLVARVWDARNGRVLMELKDGHPPATFLGRRNTLYCAAFGPDGKSLATGDRAGTVCFWNALTGKLLYKTAAATFYSQAFSRDKLASEYEWGGVRCLAFSADGKLLVAGGMGPADQNSAGIDGPMRIEAFDTATGKSVAAFMGAPKGMLTTTLFHPTAPWVLAGGGGGQAGSAGIGSLWAWNPRQLDRDGKSTAPVIHPSAIVIRDLVLSPDGNTLLAIGMQRDLTAGRIEIWDLTGKPPPATAPKPASAKK